MRKKVDPGKIYDEFAAHCPQTITREDFIKEVNELSCPHRMMNDLQKMTFERDRRRTIAALQKRRIDDASNR